jgi:hypothetical protein
MRSSLLVESILLALPAAARANVFPQRHASAESKQLQGFAGVPSVAESASGSVGSGPSFHPPSVRAFVDYLRSQAPIVPSVGENIPGEGQ